MIDNNIFISSATLIPDMYNDYNIQSDDFVSRFPIWVANALEELKFIQAYYFTHNFPFPVLCIPQQLYLIPY